MTATAVRHPARYSRQLLPTLQAWLADVDGPILDPFAGVGASGIPGLIHNELEPEWAAQCPRPVVVGDALHLPFRTGSVAAVVTSPTYGNRMADHHAAKDDSERNTYRHKLGRPLHPANSGQLQWGLAYKDFHRAAWAEVHRVLRPGGTLILNVKDHIRKDEIQRVVWWHLDWLGHLGFLVADLRKVPCPGNRQGANGGARIDHEMLYRFRRAG